MTQWQAGLLLIAVIPVVWFAMWRGWRARVTRHQVSGGLPRVPEDVGDAIDGPWPVLYVSTTVAGQWLDRVLAHGLAGPSESELSTHTGGVLVRRTGADALWVPSERVVGVHTQRGTAGKVGEADGLVIIRWRSDDLELDLGLRPRRRADRDQVLAAIERVRVDDEMEEQDA